MKFYFLCENKLHLSLLLILQTIRTAGTVGVAILINHLINAVSTAITNKDVSSLIHWGIICIIYAFTLGGIILLTEKTKTATMKGIMMTLRRHILHEVLNKSISHHQGKNSAQYMTLLSQNLGTFEEQYLKNSLSIYDSFLSILMAVLLLLWINPMIAAISISAMSIPSFIPKFFGKKLGVLQSHIMENGAGYNGKVKDILNGMEVIKSYHCETQIENLHCDSAKRLEKSKAQMGNTMAWLYGLTTFSSISVQFLIMSLAGIFAVKGLITIGSIIAITQLTGQVISPAFQLSEKISQLKGSKPIWEQIKKYDPKDIVQKSLPELLNMKESLVLQDLTFSYGDTPVIHHVNLQFDQGKKYVIVGESGSGKSTLLKLLAGYYNNYSGRILLDGKQDKQCDIALIHQNLFLFDDTIRNNITLYEDYSEEAIREACKMASLDKIIESLPEGIDTKVLENGARFSGGEKQRIAVARAILHKKNVLLLDEATSAMDNGTTKLIEDSILSLENVTCIAITHKLTPSSLQKYDEILVMEHGKIVEQGSYEALLSLSSKFAKLYSVAMG